MKLAVYMVSMALMILGPLAGTSLGFGTPKLISYQGRATDASGNPLADGNYAFTFRLYDHSTAGVQLWTESATVTTSNGLFQHLLGSSSPLFDSYFGDNDSLFLQVSIGGENLLPRTPIVSGAYALKVNSVDGAQGGEIQGSVTLRSAAAGNLAVTLVPLSTGIGHINLSRGDGSWGASLDGGGTLGLYGSARSAVMQMSQSGSTSVQLPSDAIEASEILDEPGVGSCNNTSITLTGTPQYLCGRTMFAPVDGYVFVTATAHATIQHANGTQSTCVVGVSDNITSYVASAMCRITLPSSLPSGIYEFPIASHAIFPISEGSKAYYALGSRVGTTAATAYDVQFSEVFFPTAYTTVHNPVPPAAGAGPDVANSTGQAFDSESERLEAMVFDQARMERELSAIKAQVEALKKQIESDNPVPASGTDR